MLRSAQLELHLNRFSQSYMAIGLHATVICKRGHMAFQTSQLKAMGRMRQTLPYSPSLTAA